MAQASHQDPNTFRSNYQPRNSGVDGKATFLREEGRDLVNDMFRELTLPRNPNLWHCLPAEKQYEIENSQKFLDLEEKMAALKLETDGDHRRKENKLHREKSKLMEKELRKWQRKQPYRPGDPQGYHREIFNRCSFMMPERRNLAENLFKVDTLRSPTGIQVIRDMVALYEKDGEVEFRPGLEPDKCCCLDEDDCSKPNLGQRRGSYDIQLLQGKTRENL